MSEPAHVSGFDPGRIIQALDTAGVRYVLLGGVAARLHGSPSLTEDMDVTPERLAGNLRQPAALGTRLAAPGVKEGLAVTLHDLERQAGRQVDGDLVQQVCVALAPGQSELGASDRLGELVGAHGVGREAEPACYLATDRLGRHEAPPALEACPCSQRSRQAGLRYGPGR